VVTGALARQAEQSSAGSRRELSCPLQFSSSQARSSTHLQQALP